MKNMQFEGIITKIRRIDTEDAEGTKEEAVITIETAGDEIITIKGSKDILEGVVPNARLQVILKNPQKTLKDVTDEKQEV